MNNYAGQPVNQSSPSVGSFLSGIFKDALGGAAQRAFSEVISIPQVRQFAAPVIKNEAMKWVNNNLLYIFGAVIGIILLLVFIKR